MAAGEGGDLRSVLMDFARFEDAHPQLSADEAVERYSEMIKESKCGDARKRNAVENVGETEEGGEDGEDGEGEGERNAPVKSQRMGLSASGSSYNTPMSAQQVFAIRSGRAPQQFPVSLSRTENPVQQQQPMLIGLESLSQGAAPLADYLGQQVGSEPFPAGLIVPRGTFSSSVPASDSGKSCPAPLQLSSAMGIFAPRMQPQLSSSTSGYFTGDEGSPFDSPQSYSNPMSSHSRSYSQDSFASSYMDPTSPIDPYTFATAMSRETSSASLPHGGMSMLKVWEGHNGEMGVVRESSNVFLNDLPKRPKRAPSVNIEDLDSEAPQAPYPQKRMRGNDQEGGDASGKDSSSSSKSRRSRPRERRNGACADGDSMDQPYVRPAHPRVHCPNCTECPDGFRGDHELRRHMEREHAPTRKMWVIKDASDDKMFLSKCKACMSGKRYGQDYNAAAHLRRQHFSLKNGERRKRQQGGEQEEESSIGKENKSPDMATLRGWMEEIEVVVDAPEPWQPPEGEGTQQVSAEDRKEAVEDPDPMPTGDKDEIAPQLLNTLPNEFFPNPRQDYTWGGPADHGEANHLVTPNGEANHLVTHNVSVQFSAASGSQTLTDACAYNGNMRYLQLHHAPETYFPNLPGPVAGRDTAGVFLSGGMNFS